MSRILDNLYLGSYGDARNQAFLKKAGVTHIVTVGVELQTLFPESFKYFYIPAYDHPSYQLAPYFDQIADFIHNAIAKEKGTVFVHCQMGISRSTTSVIAYLIKHHGLHPNKAGILVKSRRAIVYPNPGFLKQLDAYAKKLGIAEENFGRKSMANATMSNGFTSLKKEVKEEPNMAKSEVKTLAMTSSMWKPTAAKELEKKAMSTTTSNWKGAVKEESKTLDKDVANDKEYCCKTCGTKLFNASNIVHDANTSSVCSTIYIKQMSWIGYSKTSSAKIYCPNGKCSSIIGFSNQNGGKCPCGKRIENMYGVYPMKLVNPKTKMGETLRAW